MIASGSVAEAQIANWPLFLVCWYPHSGGRWLNRSLLAAHPGIGFSEFFTPWLNRSVEDILSLDTTSQVHKARSLPNLADEFEMVVRSVQAGRRAGLASYFADKKAHFESRYSGKLAGGALPVGSQVGSPALDMVAELMPKLVLVHLVRHPLDCFLSLKSRRELDGDAAHAATAWVRLNGNLRRGGTSVFAGRYHCLRYEDLKLDPALTLQALCKTLGIAYDAVMISKINTYHGRNRDTLPEVITADERATVLEVTAPERAHYGYADKA